MRQRTVKNLEEKLELNSSFLIANPRDAKGKWHEIFGNNNPIYLEIGCGKGQFIFSYASQNPECNYIAIEGQDSVALRALEKAEAGGLQNLRIFIDFVENIKDYFEEGELKGVYLNFSDPWPKARHAKRRLTYHKRLANYKEVIGPEGAIEFKTDNDGLFDFTLEEVELGGFETLEMTRDLHCEECTYKSKNITTEYEDKFRNGGKNINYIKIK